MSIQAFDCEVYKDYFLAMFKDIDTGRIQSFELYENHPLDIQPIRRVFAKDTIVTFNGINFDIPIITYALTGASAEQIKALCDYIIVGGYKYWHCEKAFKFKISSKIDHIDLIEVANGKGSLKAYGGRLHSKTIQDLPIHPSDSILPEMRPNMRKYCGNDLNTTIDLYRKIEPQIKLRDEMSKIYGVDLRSKSDAQIAEAVIKAEVERFSAMPLNKPEGIPKPFKYKAPKFIEFKTEPLQEILGIATIASFIVTDGGKTLLPPLLSMDISIGLGTYSIGVGGLHSNESTECFESDDEWMISDHDVASYYPSIILLLGLYPEHIGKTFLSIYQKIFNERIEAKKNKNKVKAEVLKIVLNGSFGKFGNKYSYLFSPKLLMQVTITGQLALLMLIEQLQMAGIAVISANTDGIVLYHRRNKHDLVKEIIANWEINTGFETEETLYKAIYSRDVNNYIAIKNDASFKLKGAYAPPEPIGSSWPNPHCQICVDAVIEFLRKDVPIRKTIEECKDIKQFVATRVVKGGAVFGDQYLGRVARWYYSLLSDSSIRYKVNNYLVARTEGAVPCMTLPDQFPDDVEIDWYVKEAEKILEEVGYVR